jgi:hypothetical protein
VVSTAKGCLAWLFVFLCLGPWGEERAGETYRVDRLGSRASEEKELLRECAWDLVLALRELAIVLRSACGPKEKELSMDPRGRCREDVGGEDIRGMAGMLKGLLTGVTGFMLEFEVWMVLVLSWRTEVLDAIVAHDVLSRGRSIDLRACRLHLQQRSPLPSIIHEQWSTPFRTCEPYSLYN